MTPLVVNRLDVSRRPHDLPVFVPRQPRVDYPRVQRCLLGVGHDDERVVDLPVFLVSPGLLDGIVSGDEIVGIFLLERRRRSGVESPPASLDLRNRVIGPFVRAVPAIRFFLFLFVCPLQIGHQHRIRESLVDLGQGRQVVESGQDALECELLRRVVLQSGNGLRIRSGPCVVKQLVSVDEIVVRQILHDRVDLDDAVRYRRSGREHDAAPATLQPPDLDVQVERFLRPMWIVHSGDPVRRRHVLQVLELMRLVHRQIVDAERLEIQPHRVLVRIRLFGERPKFLFVLLQTLLYLRHGALAFLVLPRRFERLFQEAYLFLYRVPDIFHRRFDELHAAVTDNDGVEIPRRNTGEQPTSVFLREIGLRRREDLRRWVQSVEVLRPLRHQVIRNDDQRLLGQPQTPALHHAGDDGERLPRADDVVQKHVERLDHPPCGVDLRTAELDRRARSDGLQIADPVVFPVDVRVHLPVECVDDLLGSHFIRIGPVLEHFGHPRQNRIDARRFVFEYGGLPVRVFPCDANRLPGRGGIENPQDSGILVVELHPEIGKRIVVPIRDNPTDPFENLHPQVLHAESFEEPLENLRRHP